MLVLDDNQDRHDALDCLAFINGTSRCAGERIIVDGYVCIHCGCETPESDCKAPKKGYGRKARTARAA